MSHVCDRPEAHSAHYYGYGRFCEGRAAARIPEVVESDLPALAASEYVVLRRSDAEALHEEHAIFDDPFWRPLALVGAAVEVLWGDDRTVEARVAKIEGLNAYDPEHEQLHIVVTVDGT